MVMEADELIAARAASIAATMAGDPIMAVAAVPILAAAALHADSGVRAAAAIGAARAGSTATQVIKILLADVDPAVRCLAFRGLSPPLEPSVATLVENLAADDPDPVVHDKAVALAARTPTRRSATSC